MFTTCSRSLTTTQLPYGRLADGSDQMLINSSPQPGGNPQWVAVAPKVHVNQVRFGEDLVRVGPDQVEASFSQGVGHVRHFFGIQGEVSAHDCLIQGSGLEVDRGGRPHRGGRILPVQVTVSDRGKRYVNTPASSLPVAPSRRSVAAMNGSGEREAARGDGGLGIPRASTTTLSPLAIAPGSAFTAEKCIHHSWGS